MLSVRSNPQPQMLHWDTISNAEDMLIQDLLWYTSCMLMWVFIDPPRESLFLLHPSGEVRALGQIQHRALHLHHHLTISWWGTGCLDLWRFTEVIVSWHKGLNPGCVIESSLSGDYATFVHGNEENNSLWLWMLVCWISLELLNTVLFANIASHSLHCIMPSA